MRLTLFVGIAALLLSGDFCYCQTQEKKTSGDVPIFENATAFAVDPLGNRYVLDGVRDIILKLDPTRSPARVAGGYGWSEAMFDQPKDIDAPNGLDVYVADYGNHRIVRYDYNLNYISAIPPASAPEGTDPPFRYPRSVAVSRLGALFIIDGDNGRIVKYTNENTFEQTFGNTGIGDARLRTPTRVRVTDDDRVYVQDGACLKVFDAFGNYVETIGRGIFRNPVVFTVERKNVCVADSSRVFIVREHSRIDTLTSGAFAVRQGDEHIIDIAIHADTVFALTTKRITVLAVGRITPGK